MALMPSPTTVTVPAILLTPLLTRNVLVSTVALSTASEKFTVMSVPNCGKGEPNQSIYVGHASPTCRFDAVEVFGGES